jgi:putative DNA primase/helicase
MTKSFCDFLLDHGYDPPELIDDGRIHRFRAPDERGSKKSAWFVYFGTAGVVGDWRTGEKLHWFDKDKIKSDFASTYKKEKTRLHSLQIQRYQERGRNRQRAKDRARVMWSRSHEIPSFHDHPYLQMKGIDPHGTREYRGLLLVPLYHMSDVSGITNLQCVSPDGTKRFLRDGLVEGGFYRIGFPVPPKGRVYICEGFATAATVHELTGHSSVVAFNCGNLLAVANLHRQYSPIIVADNDHSTVIRGQHVNPGLDAAMKVAAMMKLEFVVPIYGDTRVTDFNDLRIIGGDDEAKRQIKIRVKG